MWLGTNGATLSLQRTAEGAAADVVIAQAITVHQGTAYPELKRVFDNICLVALDWKVRLENVQSGPLGSTDQNALPFGYGPPLA